MKSSKYSRRLFLEGLGLSAAFLPLIGTDVIAAPGGIPKRLLVIAWTNGYTMEEWRPKADFGFGEILKPLESFKDKVTVIDGVSQSVHYEANAKALGWGKDQWYGGHDGYPGVLTGVPLSKYADNLEWSGGDSIDQYIAGEIAKTTQLKFESLVVGPNSSGGYYGTVSYKGKSPGITPEKSHTNFFKKLFGGGALPSGQISNAALARKSILDYLGKDLTRFGNRLGGDDKVAVQEHLASIRAIEKQLQTPAGGMAAGGGMCTMPSDGAGLTSSAADYPKVLKVMADMIVTALRCDLTRVVTLPFTNAGGDNMFFPWLGSEFVGKGDEYPERQYHDITHNAGRSADHKRRKTMVEQWFFSQVAYLAGQFKTATEAGTTTPMLDNTLIMVTNSMGTNHDSKLVPFTLVGNLGGAFKTGRTLKFNTREAHNKVMVSVANAMGVDGSKWGEPKYAVELPGLRP